SGRARPGVLIRGRVVNSDGVRIERARREPIGVMAVLRRQNSERTEELVHTAGVVRSADVTAADVGVLIWRKSGGRSRRGIDRPCIGLRIREGSRNERSPLGDIERQLAGPEVVHEVSVEPLTLQ